MPKFLTVCLCLVIAGSWADTSVEVTKTNCTQEGRKLGETYNVLSCLECTCFDNGREVCQRQFCSVYCLKEPLYQEGGLCCQSCSDMIQLSGYRSRKEGRRIHLTCTATGTGIEPANGIHWFKEGKELLNDTKNDIQKYASKDGKLILSVLSIDDADINDSGGYACSSRRNDRVGLDVKVFNSLTALERGYVTNRLPIPEFRPTKTNVTGVVGGGVVLKCLIKYVDGNRVTWWKGSKPLPLVKDKNSGSRFTKEHGSVTEQWNLEIDNLTLEDSGQYACQVEMYRRTVKQMFTLQVNTGSSSTSRDNEKQHSKYINVTGVPGGAVTLKCYVEHPGKKTVIWRKDSSLSPLTVGRTVFVDDNNIRISNGSHRGEWNLVINNLTPGHSGVYECAVPGKQKHTSIKVYSLQVNAGNSSTSRDNEKQHSKYINVTGVPGGAVTLKCYVEHLGKKTVIWRKDSSLSPLTVGRTVFVDDNNIRISNGSHRGEWNLMINNLTPGHSGVYECAVPGKQKHTSIKVYSLQVNEHSDGTSEPSIAISGSDNVDAGGTIRLSCNISDNGVRSPHVDWFRNGSKLRPIVGSIDITQHASVTPSGTMFGSALIMVDSDVNDSGTYTCRASNMLTAQRQVTVTKRIAITGSENVTEESTIRLSCYIFDNRTGSEHVEWFKDGIKLRPTPSESIGIYHSAPVTLDGKVSISTLVMRNADIGDSGLYVCRSSNLSIAYRQVTVTKLEKRPENIVVAGVVGGNVTLVCSVRHGGTKTVIWRKAPFPSPITEGKNVYAGDPNIRISHVRHKGQWNLVIDNLTPQYSGYYQCIVNDKQRSNQTIIIGYTLQVKAENVSTSPDNEKQHSKYINVTGVPGGAVTLKCYVEHLGTKTVIWRTDSSPSPLTIGRTVFVDANNIRISNGSHKGEWNLVINNLTPAHSGVYECLVPGKQKHTSIKKVYSLQVNDHSAATSEPSIAISGSDNVEAGETIRLSCNVSDNGVRPPHFDWFKDGGKLRSFGITQHASVTPSGNIFGSALIIEDADVNNSGTYVCRASTSQTKVTAQRQVTVTKRISIAGSEYEKEGNTIRLSCYIPGNRTGSEHVDWFKDGIKQRPSPLESIDITQEAIFTRHGKVFVSTLVKRNADIGDSGLYVCRSSNLLIEDRQVTVTKRNRSESRDNAETLPKNIHIAGVVGGNVTLECSVRHGGTKTVIWRVASSPSPLTVGRHVFVGDPNFRISHEKHKGQWNLVIDNLAPHYSGMYECIVHNKQRSIQTLMKVYTLQVKESSSETQPSKRSISLSGAENVEEGSAIRLSCNISDNSLRSSHVDWFKDGNKLTQNPADSITISQQISITPGEKVVISLFVNGDADVDDSGTYVCRAPNMMTAQRQVTVIKRHFEDPSFDSVSSNVTVELGQTAVLPCSVNNLGGYLVAWMNSSAVKVAFQDMIIVDNNRLSVESPSEKEWNLHIAHVRKKDAGRYYCYVNTNPVTMSRVYLYVIDPYTGPRFETTRTYLTVVEGQTAVLPCSIKDIRHYHVAWANSSKTFLFHKNQRLVDDTRMIVPVERPDLKGWKDWNLHIRDVRKNDSGEYTCMVNTSPVRKSQVYFNVVSRAPSSQLPLGISLSGAENVEEGSAIRLSCNISDNSLRSSHIDWFKDGNKLTQNPADSVTISQQISITPGEKVVISSFVNGDADVDDSGTYVCRAPNMMTAQRQVTVIKRHFEDPSFDSVSSNVTVELGQTAVLPCSVNNLGGYLVAWMNSSDVKVAFQDMIIVDNNRLSVESPSEKEWNLHIAHVRKNDAGRYDCYVNTNPVTMSRVYLNVVDPYTGPRFKTDRTYLTVVEGQTAVLPCSIKDVGHYQVAWVDSTKTFLFHKNRRLVDDTRMIVPVERTGLKGWKDWNLHIRDVRKTDSGEYTCMVNTSPGRMSRVYLNVVLKAPSSQLPLVVSISGAEYVEKGDSIILSCNISGEEVPRQFTWFKDGIELNSKAESILIRHGVSVSPRGEEVISDFENRNADIDDSGTYVCKASDTLMAEKKVIVIEPSTEPSFDNPTSNVTVYAGKTAVLPCSIKRLGDHSVAWTKGKDWVLTHGSSRIVSDRRISLQRPYTKEWNLHIRRVRYEDTGDYFCNIDTDPVKYAQVFLNVVSYPIMTVPPPSDPESRAVETVLNGSLIYPSNNKTGEVSPSKETDWFRDIMETSSSAVKGFRQAISRASKQFRNQITKAFKAFKTKLSSAAKD